MPDIIRLSNFKSALILLTGFLVINSISLEAQIRPEGQSDTIIIEADQQEVAADTSYHDPKKAVLYSALLPGLGQIYNKKAWKVPIIYAGFGTFGYFIDRNTRYYKDLKQKLVDPAYELKYFEGNFTEDQLTRGKDTYKRWQEMSIIGIVAFYGVQIIDASVDAYMFDWDVSTDLSLRIEPAGIHTEAAPFGALGLRACLSF